MKIVISNIYFGTPPGYFDLFLKSCGLNPEINFLFFVDFDIESEVPQNVKFVSTTFENIRQRFQVNFDFPLALHSPYKLTDFQPAYGDLLAEYFTGYDWWGHCDFDMIFGDLSPLIEIAGQENFVKVFRRGHLTLYRNTVQINGIYKKGAEALDYRYIFSTERFLNFDETNGIDKVFLSSGLSVCHDELIADINPKSPFLYTTVHPNKFGQYFTWSNGKLTCKCLNTSDKEFLYIHFQKRYMAVKYEIRGKADVELIINQFGLFDDIAGIFGRILLFLCFIPNLAHLKRFYLPRIARNIKSKLVG
ncbi:MAG: hypothetical protein BVN35_05655 [Proteobacteria bacterium ST_bin11]|nr:MAG: hypothetical protein BVN35_05655 [Proteobacteria bacterium ST_bin11]